MGQAKLPRSLRSRDVIVNSIAKQDGISAKKVTTVAGLIAVASISGAEAQQSQLPPVTVDSPIARAKPASKPTPDQKRATAALRRAAKRNQMTQVKPVPYPNAGGLAPPDADPYANPNAPYMATRLQSNKFSEPIVNTPRSITVLTSDVIEDKNATSLREIGRTTAGVTLGSGEGGNAFGDRFFIRGFDARNDIFVDGIRDPAVSIRENFFTEQVEILRGPASTYAGRGTAGGAINIVTKQAGDQNFYNAESTLGTDQTRRITVDVNQVINPTLSVRLGGLAQGADIAERNFTTDNRYGGFASVKWTPTDTVKVLANYIHTDLNGIPDFGVPWDRVNNRPVTESGVPRDTWYGEINRDFQKAQQDIGTVQTQFDITPYVTLHSNFRAERSVLNYIGTIAETPSASYSPPVGVPLSSLVQLNAQSRYQVTNVLANQSDVTTKFGTGDFKHTLVTGVEFSRESVSIDKYAGLYSEGLGVGMPSTGSAPVVPYNDPSSVTYAPFAGASLTGTPLIATIDTKSVYAIDTANYHDFIILNGGVRYDDYNYSAVNYASPVSQSSVDNGLVNYNVGIVVKPLPIASVYAAYATSSNPVGAELDATSAAYGGQVTGTYENAGQAFAPERNRSAEVGTKWELFDRRLLVTGALFQTWKDNAREAGKDPLTGNQKIYDGNNYWIRGIDIEAAGKITDKWSVFGGIVLMQSRVTQSSVVNPTAFVTSDVGLQLANIAHQSFNVLTKYQVLPDWEVGGQATYRSKIYGGSLLAANQNTSLPDYWRFDAFVEHPIDKHLTIKLAVNNIFNKLYYDTLYQSAAPFVMLGPGRVGYLVASAKF